MGPDKTVKEVKPMLLEHRCRAFYRASHTTLGLVMVPGLIERPVCEAPSELTFLLSDLLSVRRTAIHARQAQGVDHQVHRKTASEIERLDVDQMDCVVYDPTKGAA